MPSRKPTRWSTFGESPATSIRPIGPTDARALPEICAEVVAVEWPAMQADNPVRTRGRQHRGQLWKFAGQSQAHSGADSIASYQFMEELRMLTGISPHSHDAQ